MYCPRCSTQNNPELRYCRQCGLPLAHVRFALESRIDEVLEKYKKGQDKIGAGLVTIGIFFLIGLGNLLFGSALGFAVNLILGILIALPIITIGFKHFNRVNRLLEIEGKTDAPAIGEKSAVQLPAAPDTDRSLQMSNPGSVTEHTTFELKEPEKSS